CARDRDYSNYFAYW
nr:immunoglobulin heavy chain junction region [Mus musculus]